MQGIETYLHNSIILHSTCTNIYMHVTMYHKNQASTGKYTDKNQRNKGI